MVESVRRIIAEGLGVELWLSEEGHRPFSQNAITEVRDVCRTTALPVTAHTGVEQWNPPAIRAEIGLAAHLGIRQLVVHRTTLGLETPDFNGIANLTSEAADLGVILALENGKGGMTVIRPALEMVPALAFCLDTSHACVSMHRDGVAPETILAEWTDRLVEVHVSDSDGIDDLHAIPGAGVLNWPSLLPVLHSLPLHVVLCLELFAPADPVGALHAGRSFLQRD